MIDEILYKEQIDAIKEYVKKNQYISLAKISEIFDNNISDELLDDIVEYLDNEGVEITKDSEEVPSEEELLTEIADDDFEAFVEDLETDDELGELASAVDSEIKVSDFEDIVSVSYSADDPVKMYLRDIGQIDLLTITQESEYARMYQESLMCQDKIDTYKKQGKQLSEDELNELNEKIELGEEARKILIESNLRLVVSIAKRYLGRGLPFLDLIQEGNMGLMKAVNKFDPTKGFKFSTYATWWIRQAITRAIADNARTIRIPVHMVETINKLVRTTRRLTQEKRREPTAEEIAAEMKISVEKVQQIQRIAQEPMSFDATVGEDDDSSLGDFIDDKETLNPLEYTQNMIYREEIEKVLQTLTPREEKVIRLRYGLDDNRPRTLEEVGKEFGVTRERIRQIEAKAIRRLRHPSRLKRLEQHRVKY
ncbi:MAG TPA: RNA polymerase sigma factor RpoD [Acholeplasmatales bacterium]|jgi:RNA polymerase sigma factor, sigma-70 family|nr:RNA polymerase sigma factor RpoD [Bacilli bacterium]MBS6561800.1 RNA polymerase sigma factor RpoD [Staphylococcus sp.]CDC69679.1 rNA polymerase sigma factor [Staphylococcus sp. CAG:324]HAR57795.1 RNA polymerase sigma factor RpoD [Acholeplasmatales bacterium]